MSAQTFAELGKATADTKVLGTGSDADKSDNVSLGTGVVYTVKEEAIVVRKIDNRLLPLMLVTYMLQYLDKVTLSSASIMGFRDDLHLSGSQYSWASSIFYFGYLFASYPGSIGLTKLPLSKFLSTTIILWAIVLIFHVLPHNFAGIMALRYILGTCESVISPGFSLITTVWYKPSEHASRHGAWFVGNSLGSIFSGFLSYGIAHITTITPWKVLFIFYGGATLVWGVVLLVFLPASPASATFLTVEERRIAVARVVWSQVDADKKYDWGQVKEAATDLKTYLLIAYSFLTCMANGALTNFGNIVISGFGFSTVMTLLLQVPLAVLAVLLIILSSWIANKVPWCRCYLIMTFLLMGVTGATMVRELDSQNRIARLWGMYLFSMIPCAFPLVLSMIASNVAGQTKKTFVQALFFISYCIGNICGPQVFLDREAPSYTSAFTTMIVCVGLAFIAIGILRIILSRENRKRDSIYGPGAESVAQETAGVAEDLTDIQRKETFRYMY